MVIVCNLQLPTFRQVVLRYERAVAFVLNSEGGVLIVIRNPQLPTF
jgi:hypothetical protein